MQLVPMIAQRIGWRWSFAILALGPIAGIAAIRRFAELRAAGIERANLSLST
jgi:predicted MFS family arabinose efflux permease